MLNCRALVLVAALLWAACATDGGAARTSLYPARPELIAGPPQADPPLQRPTLHTTITREGFQQLLDALVPNVGAGAYALVGVRNYTWARGPFALKFDDAKKTIFAHTLVQAHVEIPGGSMDLPLVVDADVQPVMSAQHQLVMQAVVVTVTSQDARVKVAQWGAGLVTSIEAALKTELENLRVDLTPALAALHDKLSQPVFLPLGDASACFVLDVRGIEAGPTIFAGGFEKQLALVVAPSITMPCTVRGVDGELRVVRPGDAPSPLPALPALHNTSSIEGGPFHLTMPVAAGYDELEKAMGLAFTDGKLFFSAQNPNLYLFDPHVYASDGALVASMKIGGHVTGAVSLDVDGEIFLSGHPRIRDNFVEVPDVKPTIETQNALLKLAAYVKQDELTAAVRRALRLDLSARMQQMKRRLVDALSVSVSLAPGVPALCTSAEVGRVEVTSVEAHDAYLRLYVDTTATADAQLPCAAGAPLGARDGAQAPRLSIARQP